MEFELLDGYLLDGSPAKGEVVKRLLETPPGVAAAGPFLEGMRLLGARTPDLTLIALRLVLAGHRADDGTVVELRQAAERARAGDSAGRRRYAELVAPV